VTNHPIRQACALCPRRCRIYPRNDPDRIRPASPHRQLQHPLYDVGSHLFGSRPRVTSDGRLEPYRQGQLDGLCGIYAIINAIRTVLANRMADFCDADWQELFRALLIAADEEIGATTAAGCGLEPKSLRYILRAAVRHMADEHDLALIVDRVLRRKDRPTLQDLLPRLADLVRQPNTAILLTLSGHLDHWTVVGEVGRNTLELFDSSGFARVAIANCRMLYEWPCAPGKREHIINPRAVFSVRLATMAD
jgi:hypothetical protein